MKNAFFLDLRAAKLAGDAVRVQPPGGDGSGETDDDLRGEWELAERDFEALLDGDAGFGEELADDEDAFEAEEFARHADFEEPPESEEAAVGVPDGLLLEEELESWASALASRDENRLTNFVFHARHPERGGRPIEAGDRALAAEWLAIRDKVVRPLLRGAAAPPPSAGTAAAPARGRVRSTRQLRQAWADDRCRDDRMVSVRILGRSTPANRRTVEAWAALDRVLRQTSYETKSVWVYNCRDIAGTTSPSLHSYGLAVDIDPKWNPNRRTPDRRLVRFSTGATQQDRLADVRRGSADTVFTTDQVAAVEAIRTVDGHQVFTWGGRWATTKDTMHFQLNVTPEELARGIAP
jgi:hypothetical protein